ncbi:MAG TPA: leucyl aminopeptidase [Candidatus Cloacimonadota bacterium]|nr:leucyl aminopeptidase [Candidatus Cloacimonadota bacterium]HQL14823.1 leucyl aminopeptidase [Candidatus Cloacimonadota bacterium]
MKIDVVRKLPDVLDTIVLCQYEKGKLDVFEEWLPDAMLDAVKRFINAENITFQPRELYTFHYYYKHQATKIILVGMPKSEQLTAEQVRYSLADIIRLCLKLKSKQIYILPGFDFDLTDAMLGQVLAETALLTIYKFDKYLSETSSETLDALHLVQDTKNTRNLNKGILEGRILADATNLARDLVNEPANVITPDTLAEAAKKAALEYSFQVEIYNMDKLRRLKMEAFLAVGKGSKYEPRLIIMRHQGNPDARQDITALIGKGITFDSGGYCLKSPQGMANMKTDMAGAAAVIGTMAAIANLKLNVNVTAIIAACENMVSGEAYHAGDIVRSMSGKTIEVINTDAEGRLTLIDAIHYAIDREHASRIIDIATLTGAAVGALGTSISAVVTNDQNWYAKLEEASELSGEHIWQLPAFEEYKSLLKSEIADLKNTGAPWGGAITAALFIQEFVQNLPWLHIDIAGTASKDKESGYFNAGATGVGVRLLTTLLKSME